MKIETAIGILNKEREFEGLSFSDLLQDIQNEGKMIYSERVMEAFERFMTEMTPAQKSLFAPVAK